MCVCGEPPPVLSELPDVDVNEGYIAVAGLEPIIYFEPVALVGLYGAQKLGLVLVGPLT